MPPHGPAPSSSVRPVCPRCGYDLDGIPRDPTLDGRCPECGLDFAWIDVLDPTRHEIPWLFEHTPRRHLGLGRAWSTLFRTLIPWRFWRAVTLSSRVSVPRLLVWPFLLILPLHVIWGTTRIATRLLWLRNRGVSVTQVGRTEWREILTHSVGYPLFRVNYLWPGWTVQLADPDSSFVLPLGATLLAPLVLLVLANSRATSKVRAVHIARAAVYGAGWIAGWYALWTLVSLALFVRGVLAGPAALTSGIPLSVTGRALRAFELGSVGLCLVWFAAYWYFALTTSMKLHRARLIWALLMLACLLLGLNFALLDPGFTRAVGRVLTS